MKRVLIYSSWTSVQDTPYEANKKGRQHEQQNNGMVAAGIKIMWKEQLVDPPNEYIK